ncbi:hypothetical protein VTN00DRAFT_7529 [Thermoascus crustaceus]|uniref:uncharacterized protein n=1 Tax=Thermoascus crustaceus TaxID=5088 RepID=UPI0037444C3D
MSVDAMEIDSPAVRVSDSSERERKRKHKQKDHTPSKKRKHDDDNAAAADSNLIAKEEEMSQEKKSKKSKDKKKEKKDKVKATTETTEKVSDSDSPFKLITSTLYLPLSPISISPTHALASLLAEHLSPLLLTYYPPFKGVILAYSDASISSKPPTASSVASKDTESPQQLTLATTAGEYGVLYVYLTATFLVFRPQRGQILEGWVNVQSEGFLGAVVYNLFSVGVERRRLPADWKWIPPGEEEKDLESQTPKKKRFAASPDEDFDPEKEHFTPLDLATTNNALEDEAEDAVQGYFESASGHRVRGTVRFRVRDVDIIPGAERDRAFLSIEGTMLPPEEEMRLVQEERSGVSSSTSSRRGGDSTTMTGALAGSSSAASSSSNPSGSQEIKEESSSKSKKEKKEKDKDKSSKSKSKKKEK